MIPQEKRAAVSRGLEEAFSARSIKDVRRMTQGLSSDLVLRMVQRSPYVLRIMTRVEERNGPRFASMKTAGEAALTIMNLHPLRGANCLRRNARIRAVAVSTRGRAICSGFLAPRCNSKPGTLVNGSLPARKVAIPKCAESSSRACEVGENADINPMSNRATIREETKRFQRGCLRKIKHRRLRAGGAATLIAHTPIERTELVPAASQLTTSFANTVLAVTAFIKLSQDESDRFVYARFLAKPIGGVPVTAVRAATVQLCDRDDPAPAHDDAKLPKTGASSRTTGKSITTTVTYQPPTANKVLGTAVTDWDGRAIFVLRPGTGTFAGAVTTGPLLSSVRPTLGAGHFESPNGLFVNDAGKRLGAPATPVTYTFTRQQVTNPGPH